MLAAIACWEEAVTTDREFGREVYGGLPPLIRLPELLDSAPAHRDSLSQGFE